MDFSSGEWGTHSQWKPVQFTEDGVLSRPDVHDGDLCFLSSFRGVLALGVIHGSYGIRYELRFPRVRQLACDEFLLGNIVGDIDYLPASAEASAKREFMTRTSERLRSLFERYYGGSIQPETAILFLGSSYGAQILATGPLVASEFLYREWAWRAGSEL